MSSSGTLSVNKTGSSLQNIITLIQMTQEIKRKSDRIDKLYIIICCAYRTERNYVEEICIFQNSSQLKCEYSPPERITHNFSLTVAFVPQSEINMEFSQT